MFQYNSQYKKDTKNPFYIIGLHSKILFALVKSDIRQKYAGSILGLIWLVLYPVLFLLVYAGVYLFIFKIRIPELSNWGYVLMVFCGLIPYIGFSDGIQQGTQSLTGNQNLIKNTIFPVELIPVKTVLCSQAVHGVSIFILTLFVVLSGYISLNFWVVPLAFLLQLLLIQGLAWILSAVSIVIKDVQYFLNLFLLFLLFVSPVAFVPEMVPPFFRRLLYLNPLHYIISIYRAGFFKTSSLQIFELIVICFISVSIFLLGFLFFKKVQRMFLEYV